MEDSQPRKNKSRKTKKHRKNKTKIDDLRAKHRRSLDRRNEKLTNKQYYDKSGILDTSSTRDDLDPQDVPLSYTPSKSDELEYMQHIDLPFGIEESTIDNAMAEFEAMEKDSNNNLLHQATNIDALAAGPKIKEESLIDDIRQSHTKNMDARYSDNGSSKTILLPGHQHPRKRKRGPAKGSRRGRKAGRGRGRGSGRGRGRRSVARIREDNHYLNRHNSTPFNTDAGEWIKDIVALNIIKQKRKKLTVVSDFLTYSNREKTAELTRKKGVLRDSVRSIKNQTKNTKECIQELKKIAKERDIEGIDDLLQVLGKQQEMNEALRKSLEEYSAFAHGVMNSHNLQESFVVYLKDHSNDLDKNVCNAVNRFVRHVPSHRFVDKDYENRVLATSMFQIKEWNAGRYGRPPIGITTKKTSHVTKFTSLLNTDIPDANTPTYPDI